MQATEPHNTQITPGAEWQGGVKSALDGCCETLLGALKVTTPTHSVRLHKIKETKRSVSLRLEAAGQRAYLKVFAQNNLGKPAYVRERTALCVLKPSGLVPEILAYSDPRQFVMTEWVETSAEDYPVASGAPTAFAFELGQWIAKFDYAVPNQPANGNWYTYFLKFGEKLNLARIEGAAETLSAIPLCGRALARNDAALQNFLFPKAGQILGCDFEKARMRPRGWDFVQGFVSLIERFPEQVEDVLEAYGNGFESAHKGVLLTQELSIVARIFYAARVAALANPQEDLLWL